LGSSSDDKDNVSLLESNRLTVQDEKEKAHQELTEKVDQKIQMIAEEYKRIN
jgi:hypothetical protein